MKSTITIALTLSIMTFSTCEAGGPRGGNSGRNNSQQSGKSWGGQKFGSSQHNTNLKSQHHNVQHNTNFKNQHHNVQHNTNFKNQHHNVQHNTNIKTQHHNVQHQHHGQLSNWLGTQHVTHKPNITHNQLHMWMGGK